jgi:hypothetical protein
MQAAIDCDNPLFTLAENAARCRQSVTAQSLYDTCLQVLRAAVDVLKQAPTTRCNCRWHMGKHPHDFLLGDKVRALRRPGFPDGTVVQLLDGGFVLVRWQGDLLETAQHTDIERAPD